MWVFVYFEQKNSNIILSKNNWLWQPNSSGLYSNKEVYETE